MNAGGKNFLKIIPLILVLFFAGVSYLIYSNLDSIKSTGRMLLSKTGIAEDWYVLGSDACAPLNQASPELNTPEDVIEKHACVLLEENIVDNSKVRSSVMLDCTQQLGMQIKLINGEDYCNIAFDALHRLEQAELIGHPEAHSHSHVNTQNLDPDTWYFVDNTNTCIASKKYDVQTPQQFVKKMKCETLTTQTLFGSAEPDHYTFTCKDLPLETGIMMVKGYSNCQKSLGVAATTPELDSKEWYLLSNNTSCIHISEVEHDLETAKDFLLRYSCKARTLPDFPNMFRADCVNTTGEILMVYKKENCESAKKYADKLKAKEAQ